MIDWVGVVIATIWIMGLALLLAVVSIAYWSSSATRTSLGHVLAKRSFYVALRVGIVLFGLGMLMGTETWWEKILWGLVTVFFVWEAIATLRIGRQPSEKVD